MGPSTAVLPRLAGAKSSLRMTSDLKPPDPEPVDGGVGDGGGGDAAGFAPGASVEDAGDGGEDDVAPVEMRGAHQTLVEVREAEDDGCGDQSGFAADAAFKK